MVSAYTDHFQGIIGSGGTIGHQDQPGQDGSLTMLFGAGSTRLASTSSSPTINKKNGKIENKGNHEHLMEHSAVYKKLQLQEKSNEN